MFDTFAEWDISVSDSVTIHGRSAGNGPPVVLLHGHPRTHTTWYRVAPKLVQAGLTVVCPDLRGYGRSAKPDPDENHEVYCDRAMAADVVALMRSLGHSRFAVVGHDRGSYVAYRTALDHPDSVSRLGVLDSVPILEALERAGTRFATAWWHWFFLGASPHAERVITADPLAWYRPNEKAMGHENYLDMTRAVTDPATVRAMLEDYRAGLTVDRARDEGGPGGAARHRLSDARRLVRQGRHGGSLRRPGRHLADLGQRRVDVGPHRLRAPHGRGKSGPALGNARPVPPVAAGPFRAGFPRPGVCLALHRVSRPCFRWKKFADSGSACGG
ncbi:alpha/beta fold hydrolase [Amycolatopsis nivea]